MIRSSKLKIDFSKPLIFLAPMEGVVDAVLRELLTLDGHVDVCVTEFLRITNHLHSNDIFYKYCPELRTENCKTSSGTPVVLQLLGSNATAMAENAAKAAELGACGIDLNFGCPAKTVNNHDGGAALLKTPDRIFSIVSAVRSAVPQTISVSAKIRLGFDDKNYVTDIASAIDSAGASWLCIHARTKTDGYKPPAYWEYIAPVTRKISIPLIANGEVWNSAQYSLCQERSQTKHVMIGRGLVANPGLAAEIKTKSTMKDWSNWRDFLLSFLEKSKSFRTESYAVQRMKQTTKMMGQSYGEALILHENIKRLNTFDDVLKTTLNHFRSQLTSPSKMATPPKPQIIVRRSEKSSPALSVSDSANPSKANISNGNGGASSIQIE